MAADRTNPKVAYLSSSFYPAVLRLIRDVIKAAHADAKMGRDVRGTCRRASRGANSPGFGFG